MRTFFQILKNNDHFNRQITLFQNKQFKLNKFYPLDYILERPDILRERSMPKQRYLEMMDRRAILKNVVFRRILEIRVMKGKQ